MNGLGETINENWNSEIRFEKLPKMRIAKHIVISLNPEEEVSVYMDNWAKESGLMDLKDYIFRSFGWDIDVDDEDKENNPNFRGYAKCITVPEDFAPKHNGVETLYMQADEYAVLRITDPFSNPFERIPGGWQKLWKYVKNSGYMPKVWDNRHSFEEVIEIDGLTYMDVYVPRQAYNNAKPRTCDICHPGGADCCA